MSDTIGNCAAAAAPASSDECDDDDVLPYVYLSPFRTSLLKVCTHK